MDGDPRGCRSVHVQRCRYVYCMYDDVLVWTKLSTCESRNMFARAIRSLDGDVMLRFPQASHLARKLLYASAPSYMYTSSAGVENGQDVFLVKCESSPAHKLLTATSWSLASTSRPWGSLTAPTAPPEAHDIALFIRLDRSRAPDGVPVQPVAALPGGPRPADRHPLPDP